MKLRWRLGIIAGLFLAAFSLYPQFRMIYLRGSDWKGNYAYNDVDEVAYAAYLKALIDGRPRKNDPYTGRDDSQASPQPESLFSIQFAAPYTIAIPARLFGVSAPWAMFVAGAAAAFLAGLAVFWLLGSLIGDWWFAFAGTLVVFAGGAVFAGEGAIAEIFRNGYAYPYFPGFRRYIPAMAFPAVFSMIALVWKLVSRGVEPHEKPVNENSKAKHRMLVALAAAAFGYTVYSYFYVWTAGFAWFVCLAGCWVLFRPDGYWPDLKRMLGLVAAFLTLLVPYVYLLSMRDQSMDAVQMLVNTRAPDLFRMPELISYGVIGMLIFGIARKTLSVGDRSVLFVLSLAMVPLAVFNQQIITGRSLQPIHYQVFIGNYIAGLALVATLGLYWRSSDDKEAASGKMVMAGFALVAVIWGFTECFYTTRVLDDVNRARDENMPVARRLNELAKDDPDRYSRVVLNFGATQADDMPALAPQSALWAPHQAIFPGLNRKESEDRFLKYLYYLNINAQGLDHYLKTDYVTVTALFGWDRHSNRLSAAARPLTQVEIADAVSRYDSFRRDFSEADAAEPRIAYVVVPADARNDLSSIVRWYDLDGGEVLGKFILYKATLRSTAAGEPNR